MSGWKTWLGVIVTIVGTMYGMYNGTIDVATGIQAIGASVGVIGIGHKLDKNTDAVKGL